METKRASLLLMMFACFIFSSHSYQFLVGGRTGWSLHRKESFNNWAERNRFQVNDTLLFHYRRGEDSVLEVTRDAYEKCNTTIPLRNFTDGNTVFKFDHSGPFFFISGNGTNCKKGEKLIIVVMAARARTISPPAPISHPPASSPRSAPTPKEAPSPSPLSSHVPPVSPSSSAPSRTPVRSPSLSPVVSPAPVPSVLTNPTLSPANHPSGSPASSTALTPSPLSDGPSGGETVSSSPAFEVPVVPAAIMTVAVALSLAVF